MDIEHIIKTIPYKGFKIVFGYDADPESPREWDNLGTIYSNHRRYHPDGKSIEELIRDVDGNVYANTIPFDRIGKKYYYLKVWMYDHSGQTVRTGETNPWGNMGYMAWDSGLFGVIVLSKEEAQKVYGYNKCCKSLEQKVLKVLDGEIKDLDTYMTGQIFAYQTYKEDDEECVEEIDSCYGWYSEEEAITEAKGAIDAIIENENK
jgi:hypothetical protein